MGKIWGPDVAKIKSGVAGAKSRRVCRRWAKKSKLGGGG